MTAEERGLSTAELDGFNVQAAVRIEADDDEGGERLVRYCARPCFALDRRPPTAPGMSVLCSPAV